MRLSEAQKRVVRHAASDRTAMLAGGAVRSGKSYSSAMGLCVFMLQAKHNNDCALVGQSVEAVMRNIGFDLMEMAAGLGSAATLDKAFGTRIIVGGRNLWVVGANDDRARRRIQGATLAGLLIDEAVLLPQSFVLQAWARLSVEGAKAWFTFNPEGPAHWFKREMVDRIEAFDGVAVQFALDDNPTLAESVKDRYRASYTGHWRRRLVEGQWAGASGLIFPQWTACEPTPLKNGHWRFALDWGVSSVLHVLAASVRGGEMRVVGEMRHDARQAGVWTEADAVEAVSGFVNEFAHKMRPALYADPSTPESFKRLLRLRGIRTTNANNDVLPGLSRTAAALATERVQIAENACPELAKEMATYQWDDAKTELGQDKPTKQDDHGCDALRYLVHSQGFTSGARPTSVRQALGA